MKKKSKIIIAILVLLIIIVAGVAIKMQNSLNSGSSKINARAPIETDDPNVINVAMYSYVPDMKYMEETCKKMFKEIAPEVTINFVDWNCYMSNTPDNIDIFTYDAMYQNSLAKGGVSKGITDRRLLLCKGYNAVCA